MLTRSIPTAGGRVVLAATSILIGGALLSGCAVSEKSRVEQHLTATIAPGANGNDDVIMAFGLDHRGVPSEAVATGRDSR